MATHSPGVYINEVDNTSYINPSTVSTAVAVVGFATSGPIGVPTRITSYNQYKEIFGGPTVLANSSIAARSVLNISDNLIFTRVADGSVSPSNMLVKNGVEATNGKTFFNKSTDILIGTNGYKFSSIYTFEAKTYSQPSSDPGKVFYIRSPANSKLTQASILSQIGAQVEATSGRFEFQCTKYGASEGTYSFDIKVDEHSLIGNQGAVTDEESIFVTLTYGMNQQLLAETIADAIKGGSNATCQLQVVNNISSKPGDFDIVKKSDNVIVDGDVEEKSFYLALDEDPNSNSNFIHKISLTLHAGIDYGTLANDLNSILKSAYGVEVYFEEGKNAVDNNGTQIESRFLFVRKLKGEYKKVDIYGLNYNTPPIPPNAESLADATDLFFRSLEPNVNASDVPNIPSGQGNQTGVTVVKKVLKANRFIDNADSFGISYNASTQSIIIQTTNVGDGSVVELVPAPHGNYILSSVVGANIFNWISRVKGQNEIDVDVYRDSVSKAIIFESIDSIDTAKVLVATTIPGGDAQENVEKYNTSVYNDFLQLVSGVSSKKGTAFVDAIYKDIIMITTTQKGSGTTNIVVRKYSVPNPITGDTRHGIEVWEKGILKETFDDVSMIYGEVETRFDTKINNTPENGGSNYIHIDVVKNDFEDLVVQFKDGEYKVGQPNREGDRKRDADISVNAYGLYEYSVGEDGIPDDSNSLFEDVLATDGILSNTDLYDFHILITPDNIDPIVQDAAIGLAESRKDFVYIVDPPFGLSTNSVIDWHNGKGFGRGTAVNSSYAIMYWPWVKVYDGDNRRYAWVPPSTFIANKLVQLDNTKGAWFAPAGETNGRFAVGDIEYSAKQVERDALYTNYNRINPIIKYNDGSIVIFGEKTMWRENSSITKVHVRRMVVDLKKKIRVALRPFLFLPNVSSNWGKCSALINSILEVYKIGGGLTFYSVTIDATTTTPELQQQDILAGIIHIVPAGVIEQIDLTVSLDVTNETVSVI